jgi:hypothetical protein
MPEIIELISCDVQNAVGLQSRSDCIQKIVRENPALLMPPLWPRVGKEEVKGFYRIFRQQMPHCEQRTFSTRLVRRSIPRKFLSGNCCARSHRNDPSPQPRSTCNGALRPKSCSRSRHATSGSGLITRKNVGYQSTCNPAPCARKHLEQHCVWSDMKHTPYESNVRSRVFVRRACGILCQ